MQGFLSEYVVERAASIGSVIQPTNAELADINSVTGAFYGTGGSLAQTQSSESAQITLGSYLIAIAPPEGDYIEAISESRSQVVEYVVQEGDSIGFIASDYGVSVASIIWANELADADSISPGDVLKIPPVSGVLHTVQSGDTLNAIATRYDADADEIIAYNSLPKSGDLSVSRVLVIPNGTVPSQSTASTVAAVGQARSFGYLPSLDGYFNSPTFGTNWGRLHGRNGVDIANQCGTAVYAAADGQISFADGGQHYNGGFGNYIKIQHPNGTETLYAHLLKLVVSDGQSILKGEMIAQMGGDTRLQGAGAGRSTGCHLHFEVHGAQNPLAKY